MNPIRTLVQWIASPLQQAIREVAPNAHWVLVVADADSPEVHIVGSPKHAELIARANTNLLTRIPVERKEL